MICQLVLRLENISLGWFKLFFVVEALVSARILLEVALSQNNTSLPFPQLFLYIHNWFLALFFSLVFFTSYVAKVPLIKTARLLLCGLPIIFIPLLGLIFGTTKYFTFIMGTWDEVLFHISTLAAFHPNLGIFFTIEIAIFLFALLFYFLSRTTIIRSCAGIISVYSILAFFAVQGKVFMPHSISAINFLFFLFICFFIFFRESPVKAKAIFFRLRPKRFLFLATFGVIIGTGALSAHYFLFFNFFLSFVLFSFFLVHAALINDIGDLAIDKISNPSRPYAQGIFSREEMNASQYVVLGIMAILVTIIHSLPIATLTLVNVFASFLYSAARLRRRFFSFIIVAFGESTAVLYGYFAQNPTHTTIPDDVFRLFIAFFFLFCFFLPLKDLKDIKGDSAQKVKNIMTVFRWEQGKIITAFSVFFGYIIFALIVGGSSLFWVSVLFSVSGSLFVLFYEKAGEQASYANFLLFTISAAFILVV